MKVTSISSPQPQWPVLQHLGRQYLQAFSIQETFGADTKRSERFSFQAPHINADLSKNFWDLAVLDQMLCLARETGVEARRRAMWDGEPINTTEGRAVEHVHQRSVQLAGKANEPAWLGWVAQCHQQQRFSDVVHLGVGGSALGPELALQALVSAVEPACRVHTVANLDGHELQQVLGTLNPATTLFVVASKSWTTLETRLNAQAARAWLQGQGGHWADQAVAVTAKPDKARAEDYQHVLVMPESVGGRFSVWSAVGVSVALALGPERFKAMLAGAAQMDQHFVQTPLHQNLPVVLALLDVWYATGLQWPSRCVVPYHHGLRRLPAYLQQLEMESNGKRVALEGSTLPYPTAPVTWGEVGSSCQHSFFQWLHQGQQPTPVEFVLVARSSHPWPAHQRWLNASALAQAQALMTGQVAGPDHLPGHQDYPGNRPSTLLILDELTPEAFGALLALYEHRTFVAGVLWGINSFDQWGVELGKQIARRIEPALATGRSEGLDPSTAQAVQWLRQHDQAVQTQTRLTDHLV